jgi:PTH1 family peptidyl-tRNA hydrolase
LRPDGGTAGHNGVKSIRQHLGTEEFARLRVGIGRPPGKMQTPDYVLQDFSRAQTEVLPFVIDRAADAALAFVAQGIMAAMNEFNQKS